MNRDGLTLYIPDFLLSSITIDLIQSRLDDVTTNPVYCCEAGFIPGIRSGSRDSCSVQVIQGANYGEGCKVGSSIEKKCPTPHRHC